MNHRWEKRATGKVANVISHKRCKMCGIRVRRLRRGSDKPGAGWTEEQFRSGTSGPWRTIASHVSADRRPLPKCYDAKKCTTCDGSGKMPVGEAE